MKDFLQVLMLSLRLSDHVDHDLATSAAFVVYMFAISGVIVLGAAALGKLFV